MAKPYRPTRGAGGETPDGNFFRFEPGVLPLHHKSAFDPNKQACLPPLRSRGENRFWAGLYSRVEA